VRAEVRPYFPTSGYEKSRGRGYQVPVGQEGPVQVRVIVPSEPRSATNFDPSRSVAVTE
jgi:hypothetical protein